MSDYGVVAGDVCGRNSCVGIVDEHEKKRCSCHINPPCPACTELRACPACGYEHEIKNRTIEEVEGELKKVEEQEILKQRWDRKKAQAGAQTLEELREYGEMKGYKPGWADIVHKVRQRKKEQKVYG